jgi:hypothetical protein
MSQGCLDGKPCRLCCKIMGVAELDKRRYQWCTHVCEAGCGVYQSRPDDCASFRCLWLQASENGTPMADALKPSQCGAVMHEPNSGRAIVIDINDGVDWRTGALGQFIKHISSSLTILVRHRTKIIAVQRNRIAGAQEDPAHMDRGSTIHIEIPAINHAQQQVAVP